MSSKTTAAKWKLMQAHLRENPRNAKVLAIMILLGLMKFDLYPKGQRRSEAWSSVKRKKFIKAIMKGEMNLGTIIIRYDSKTGNYSMIDGSHRLFVIIKEFFKGKILWEGKKWPGSHNNPKAKTLTDKEKAKFLRNACFTAVVYKDISDPQAALIFQEANDGQSVNEPEFLNSTSGLLSDLVRIFTQECPKDSPVPSYCEDIMEYHKLFSGLKAMASNSNKGKWILRNSYGHMTNVFFLEAFNYVAMKNNIYKEDSGNDKPSRQRLYFRQSQKTDEQIDGHWDELVKADPKKARKVLVRTQESMTIMNKFMEVVRDGNNPKLLGAGEAPGAKFWNLFCFVRGLELEFKHFKIKDYEEFLSKYIELDEELCKRGETLTVQTLYQQRAGHWQPEDMRVRNGLMIEKFRAMGDLNHWGVTAGDPSFTPKQRQTQYAIQKGICPIKKKKFPLDKMEAHHSDVPRFMNGETTTENMVMISTIAHREIHAMTP